MAGPEPGLSFEPRYVEEDYSGDRRTPIMYVMIRL